MEAALGRYVELLAVVGFIAALGYASSPVWQVLLVAWRNAQM